MSRRYKPTYNPNIGFPTAYIFIILVLIILQWFRTGSNTASTAGAAFPEPNLVTNGGLFIITLFAIIACSCESQRYSRCRNCSRHCRYRC